MIWSEYVVYHDPLEAEIFLEKVDFGIVAELENVADLGNEADLVTAADPGNDADLRGGTCHVSCGDLVNVVYPGNVAELGNRAGAELENVNASANAAKTAEHRASIPAYPRGGSPYSVGVDERNGPRGNGYRDP